MTGVITGDIINSRRLKEPKVWMDALKNALSYLSSDTKYWEIYRGDSFQIELKDYDSCFTAALYLKACVKTIKGLDVRLAIGIGNKTFDGNDVTESNGEAFVFSGETLESLKKEKQNLRIKTTNSSIDKELNLYFKLALITMDNWSVNSAEIVKLSIENPMALQSELGKRIGINQNSVSNRQKRAHLYEILELDELFRHKVSLL